MVSIALPEIITTNRFDFPQDGLALEETSDNIDAVNTLRLLANNKETQAHSDENIHELGQPFGTDKDKTQFRQYTQACNRVKEFYREQHMKQTVAYDLKVRQDFKTTLRAEMTVWEAIEKLNTLIDESDPDTTLSQIEHLLQTAEAIRRDGKPRWMQLTGLIHDLGNLLYFFDAQGQWDVVGDTFPVGCAFDERIIFSETFKENPDYDNEAYSSEYGIYTPGCGVDNVMLSWAHDEYLYHVMKGQSKLPKEALAIIRFRSFYPWHKDGAYMWMMDKNGKDQKLLNAVQAFNPYDLYSKSDDVPNAKELKVKYGPLQVIS